MDIDTTIPATSTFNSLVFGSNGLAIHPEEPTPMTVQPTVASVPTTPATSTFVPTAEQILAAKAILAAAAKTTGSTRVPHVRVTNPNVTRMTCIHCKKVITYRDCEQDRIGLEKRIEKSGKTHEEFMASFNCRACAKVNKVEVATATLAALVSAIPSAHISVTPVIVETPAAPVEIAAASVGSAQIIKAKGKKAKKTVTLDTLTLPSATTEA